MIGVGRAGPLGAAAPARVDGLDEAARPQIGPARIEEHQALAVLATVEGLGPVTPGRLLLALGDGRSVLEIARAPAAVPALIRASRDVDGLARSMPMEVANSVVDAARESGAILERLTRAGVRFVTLDDEAYPSRLRAIEV